MSDLVEWLSCPNGCDAPIQYETWSYGFRAECEGCGENLYFEQ